MIVVDANHVLGLAAHAVLRAVEPAGPDAYLDQPVDHVREIGGNAGRVAEHPDTPTPQEAQTVFAKNIEAALYGHQLTLHHARHSTHFRTQHTPPFAPAHPLTRLTRLNNRLNRLPPHPPHPPTRHHHLDPDADVSTTQDLNRPPKNRDPRAARNRSPPLELLTLVRTGLFPARGLPFQNVSAAHAPEKVRARSGVGASGRRTKRARVGDHSRP